MGFETGKDFLFFEKVDMNEGLTTGTVSRGSLLATRRALYYIPRDAVSVLGNKVTTMKADEVHAAVMAEFKARFAEGASAASLEAWLRPLLEPLEQRRIYPLDELKTFKVQVGFWIFGGVTVTHRDGPRQAINLQPKAARAALAEFYRERLGR